MLNNLSDRDLYNYLFYSIQNFMFKIIYLKHVKCRKFQNHKITPGIVIVEILINNRVSNFLYYHDYSNNTM